MDEGAIVDYGEIVHAVTEPTRYKLLCMLMRHNYCVRAAARKLNISEPAVSQHINVLKRLGVVYGIKKGYQMHYRADTELLCTAFEAVSTSLGIKSNADVKVADCECEFAAECRRTAK